MEQLKELVSIVSKNKAKSLETVGNFEGHDNNIKRLYDGIAKGNLLSDEEALAYLYPNPGRNKANFSRLKRRLYQRLLTSVFFIDLNSPDYDALQKAYYTCYKDFAALKILIGRAAYKTAIPLAENILRKAIQFEFTDLAINVLREVRMLYASAEGNQRKFVQSNQLLNTYSDTYRIEMIAEEHYFELAIHFVKSRATKLEFAKIAKTYSDDLQKYLGKYNSYRFILLAYSVFALRYQIVNDYHNTLRVCEEAVAILKKKGHVKPKTSLFTFQLKIASCQIQLGDYEKSEETLKQCLKLVEKGMPTWYATNEYLLISSYHSGKFQNVLKIFLEAKSHPGFNRLPAGYREQWNIHETFIHYFIACNAISPNMLSERELGKFRLGKFLNEVPVYSKDKRGANISILILQVLFLVQQRRNEDAADRLESLKAYSHRYLRKDDTYRSNCFIHMLMQLPKGYFNKKAVERHSRKYALKLTEMPLEIANQSGEVELVPYEKLWEFVLSSLKA